jgi:excisionase family DNA binding protein
VRMNASPIGSEFLTTAEAAERLGVTRYTLCGWIRNGALPAVRMGRHRFVRLADAQRAQALTHAGGVVPLWRQEPLRAGQRLRALREAAGWNQGELATAAGLMHEAISNLEQGKKAPHAATVRRLAHALKVAPERFTGHDPVGLTTISATEAVARLGVPVDRVQRWLSTGELAGTMVSGRWRVPEIAVTELDRSSCSLATTMTRSPMAKGCGTGIGLATDMCRR